MSSVVIRKSSVSPSLLPALRQNSWKWEPLIRAMIDRFPSLRSRPIDQLMVRIHKLMIFQFRLDGLLDKRGNPNPHKEDQYAASLIKVFARLKADIPELQNGDRRDCLVLSDLGLIELDSGRSNGEQKIRTGHSHGAVAITDILAEVKGLSGQAPEAYRHVTEQIEAAAEVIIKDQIDHGIKPPLLNELVSLLNFWRDFLETVEAQTETTLTIRYVSAKTEMLSRVAANGGKFTAADIVLPPVFYSFRVSDEARANILTKLLEGGYSYLSLSSAFLATRSKPNVVIRGKEYDFSALGNCVIIPYSNHLEIYSAWQGELLGVLGYAHPTLIGIKVVGKSQLRPVEQAKRLVNVAERGNVGVYGAELSFKTGGSTVGSAADRMLVFDQTPNVFDAQGEFLGALSVRETGSNPAKYCSAAHVADGIETVAIKNGKLRIDKVEYRVFRMDDALELFRWVPEKAVVSRRLGLAFLYAADGSYLGTIKLVESPPKEIATRLVDSLEVLADVPKAKALRLRPDGRVSLNGYTSLYFSPNAGGQGYYVLFSPLEKKLEVWQEAADQADQKIGEMKMELDENLGVVEIERRLGFSLAERGITSWSQPSSRTFRWNDVTYFHGLSGAMITVHDRGDDGLVPYVEAGEFRFQLDHEPGTRTISVSDLVKPFVGLLPFRGNSLPIKRANLGIPVRFRRDGVFLARIAEDEIGHFEPHDSDVFLRQIANIPEMRSGGSLANYLRSPGNGWQGVTAFDIERVYGLLHETGVGGSYLTLEELYASMMLLREEQGEDKFVNLLQRTGRYAIYSLV